MAESDTVSSSSSMADAPDVPVVELDEDATVTHITQQQQDDPELQSAASQLQTLTLQPDADIIGTAFALDTDSVGTSSSTRSRDPARDGVNSDDDDDDDTGSCVTSTSELNDVMHDVSSQNGSESGGKEDAKRRKSVPADKSSSSSTGKKEGKKRKNPLSVLKKLTKFDKAKYKSQKKKSMASEFEQVRIDKLPQVFVAKYLGVREVKGFCGLQHVRKPVDEMVSTVQKQLEKQEQVELPLVYVVVSPKGLDIREHKQNKQKEGAPSGLVPIDFISYGVQDIKFWRVFTFIVVKELSARSKVTECHAYLCDSSLHARKMALSLGASFKIYSRNLKKDGKLHNFQVELTPPDTLAEAVNDADCDA